MFHAILLQGTKVVGVSKFLTEVFEDLPVTLLLLDANGVLLMLFQIARHSIVIEQGIIDIKQENYFMLFRCHRPRSSKFSRPGQPIRKGGACLSFRAPVLPIETGDFENFPPFGRPKDS